MEDETSSYNKSQLSIKENSKNSYLSTFKIVVFFCLLAAGLGSISIGSLLGGHSPFFFGVDYITYYTLQTISVPLGYFLIGIALFILVSPLFNIVTNVRSAPISTNFTQEDIPALRAKADRNPDKIEPIWDLGRANLQEYFNRNLSQVSNIYRLSVRAMLAGFIIILFSILIGIFEGFIGGDKSNSFTPALIGAVAGIITEFISATFLFMYRATIQQASEYMQTLERINRVGMATKILDTMSDDSKELRDKTRAELVKFLFLQDLSEEKLHSSKTKKRDEKPEDSR